MLTEIQRERESSRERLPDEVTTVGAVGGLSQVGGHKLVSVNLMDSSAHSPLTLTRSHALTEYSFFIFSRCSSCQTQSDIKVKLHNETENTVTHPKL